MGLRKMLLCVFATAVVAVDVVLCVCPWKTRGGRQIKMSYEIYRWEIGIEVVRFFLLNDLMVSRSRRPLNCC